ncbi:hypothetical protein Tco_0460655, partial [Tanacetum coccineum]
AAILLIANWPSYANKSSADSIGAGAGSGKGFELVPGGVGLLPREH